MIIARSSFACAVYPNFSQIFVVGGQVNSNEATKSCERYLIKEEIWKCLPEIHEAKINMGLCFFNHGSTIYCFGGAGKSLDNITQNTKTIEKLSKGQNSW